MSRLTTNGARLMVASFAVLSFAGAMTIIEREGLTTEAVIPVPGDRPTFGVGSTYRSDGTPVQLGDRITAQDALSLFKGQSNKAEECVRRVLGDALITQAFFDESVDHVHQYGCRAYLTSSMVRLAKEGELSKACEAFILWRFVKGEDCADPVNWGKGANCKGVWLRALAKRDNCLRSIE